MNKSPSDEAENSPKSGSHQPMNEGVNLRSQHGASAQPDISMKNFLDFLATAYRLNDALENYPLETFKKSNTIDWNQLSTCTFLSALFQNDSSDKHIQKKSHDCDNESFFEEADLSNSVKQNGNADTPHDNFQSFEKCVSEKVEDDCKPVSKQNSKRSEKHKRGRSASLGTNNGNGRGDKSKLDKRRSSFAKRESSESKSRSRSDVNIAERLVKRKLSEVLQEGILDSVLPYVIPKQTGNLSPKKPITVVEKKNCHDKSSSSLLSQNKDNISVYHSKKTNFMMIENTKDSAKE